MADEMLKLMFPDGIPEGLDVNNFGMEDMLPEYKGYRVYPHLPQGMQEREELDVQEGDIFVASYPKSGTTWLQQIVYLIHNGVNAEEASKKLMIERFPFLEHPEPMVSQDHSVDQITKSAHPWLIKTHLPFDLIPAKLRNGTGKVLYITRNPKDAVVSQHFFKKRFIAKLNPNRVETMEDEIKYFVEGMSPMSPWHKHVLSYWQHRDDPHVHIVFYERLHKDFRAEVHKIAAFLGATLTDEQMDVIEKHCSFSYMQQDRTTNYKWEQDQGIADEKVSKFMRKGKIGDWKNHFSESMSKTVDDYVDKHITPAGITFDYE